MNLWLYCSSLLLLQQNISDCNDIIVITIIWKDSARTMGVLVLDRGLFWLWVCAWVGWGRGFSKRLQQKRTRTLSTDSQRTCQDSLSYTDRWNHNRGDIIIITPISS